jgi:hypothetical protein
MLIHIGHIGRTVIMGLIDNFIDFFFTLHIYFSAIFHIDSPLGILPDFKIAFLDIEKVTNFFHVDFNDGYFDTELYIFWRLVDIFENLFD